MGLTHIEVVVASPGHPRKAARLRFLVDSGAVYSVVPGSVLRHLGIKPRMHDSMRTIRVIVAAVFAVPLLGLTLSKPRASPAPQQPPNVVACRVMEAHTGPELRLSSAIFHQQDKKEGPRLSSLLSEHSGIRRIPDRRRRPAPRPRVSASQPPHPSARWSANPRD